MGGDRRRQVAAAALPPSAALSYALPTAPTPPGMIREDAHARALSIRAEVEDADTATKRTWLERAAGYLRPAAAAGRLTRYEREVTLRRIEQQLAALGVTGTS